MGHETKSKDKASNSDLSPVSHIFNHSGYQLSTDYKKLWDLIQSGQRIPAWLLHTDKYEEPIWDLVEVKNIWGEPNDYSIGSRGIGYEGAKSFEYFEGICKKYCLHYICIQNMLTDSKKLEAISDVTSLFSFKEGEPEIGAYISLVWEDGSDCECTYNGLDKSILPLPTHWYYVK